MLLPSGHDKLIPPRSRSSVAVCCSYPAAIIVDISPDLRAGVKAGWFQTTRASYHVFQYDSRLVPGQKTPRLLIKKQP
jgi:hypothetical protein